MSRQRDNYSIVNHEEIRIKLNQLYSKNVLLSVTGEFSACTLLTTITSIGGDNIFLGGFQSERFNNELLMQNTLEVTADFEGIAVSFLLSEFSGRDIGAVFSLKALIPQSMEWVQRRIARRVKVPIKTPVTIQHKNRTNCFDIADISVAGLSYIDQTEAQCPPSIGGEHSDCKIVLPDKSVYLASIKIVNNMTIPFQHTRQMNRVGCEIKSASYQLDTALQRLINQIEASSIAK